MRFNFFPRDRSSWLRKHFQLDVGQTEMKECVEGGCTGGEEVGDGDSEMLSQRAWMDEPRFRRIVDGEKTSQIGGAKTAFSSSLCQREANVQLYSSLPPLPPRPADTRSAAGGKLSSPNGKKKSTTIKKRTRGGDVSFYSTNNQSASIFQHISRGL